MNWADSSFFSSAAAILAPFFFGPFLILLREEGEFESHLLDAAPNGHRIIITEDQVSLESFGTISTGPSARDRGPPT
jgi:hypothetical protein